jgi:DnaK suppressor protein
MINELKIKSIRKDLEKQYKDLRTQIDEETQKTNSNVINPDRSDLASNYMSRERRLALISRMEEHAGQIEAALKRIDEGTYGICSRCGKSISEERMEVLPYATLCVECQKLQER